MSEVIPADAHPEKQRACSRRKFGESEDIALLKEVLACGAHTCRRGSQMDKFDELSVSLNSNGALPWTADGKHCLDGYKLLVASFKRTDRARASASGIEERFGEKEELLADIASAVDDANERCGTQVQSLSRAGWVETVSWAARRTATRPNTQQLPQPQQGR
jgi:hypothetical protein